MNTIKLSSRNARVHFAVAFALVSIIPCLTWVYVSGHISGAGAISLFGLGVIGLGVMLPMFLGWSLLARYPAAIMRLRIYLQTMVQGKLPESVELQINEQDIVEIEKALNQVLDLLSDKLRQAEQEKTVLQEELFQSQKLEAVGTLAGGVAHALSNPINGIMNYAQLILDESEGESSVATYAQAIEKEGDRAARTVKNLLLFARQDEMDHELAKVEDMLGVVLSLCETFMRKDKVDLDIDLDERLPYIKCRSNQIQQVIMNLLKNAYDAVSCNRNGDADNKRIAVKARTFERAGSCWIRTTIEDSGAGINPEVQGKLFDPFFTTKAAGVGLGLSVSHRIVNTHGGNLTVDSRPGKGTRFHLDLPAASMD